MTEQEALIVLSAIPGLGSVRIRKLYSHFGSAAGVLRLSPGELLHARVVPPNIVQRIFEFDRDSFLQNEYNLIRQNKVGIISIFDEQYPAILKTIYDPPIVLYVKGRLPDDSGMAVGVVGSRDASVYGTGIAEKFSARLAELGITVVSGLAKGVDAAAHRGCLRTGGKTVAVVGCGLCHVYPEQNRALQKQIEKSGAVISEFSMATPPVFSNFPSRNRIISGLSMAVLVVEASLKSGALITSRFAMEQGRDVFAVPGKIDHPNSQGVNQLIKEGARLVSGFEDILQELEPQLRRRTLNAGPGTFLQAEIRSDQNFSEQEIALIKILNQEPLYIDELVLKSGLSQAELAGLLLKLEMKKIIKQLPGKYFSLV